MTNADFDTLLGERLAKIGSVLASKGQEYASTTDRLHNFKRAADILRGSRFQACGAFMTKHLVSVFDLIEQRSRGVFVDPALVDEKIGDAINYLILLEALFAEKE